MPCSPARAASMAAFKASRFVWLAISEITWMISLICWELVRICSIDSIDFCTALPPSSASWLAFVATWVDALAFSLTALTLRANSSVEAVICSTLALCVCAPWAKVWRSRRWSASPRQTGWRSR